MPLDIVTKDGFEFCDLPLPTGVEKDVLITEGAYVVGVGKIYGVFDSIADANATDADDRIVCILGEDALTRELRELAARNSARLGGDDSVDDEVLLGLLPPVEDRIYRFDPESKIAEYDLPGGKATARYKLFVSRDDSGAYIDSKYVSHTGEATQRELTDGSYTVRDNEVFVWGL